MLNLLKGIYKLFRCIRELTVTLFFILFVILLFTLTNLNHDETPANSFSEGALLLDLDGYLADNRDNEESLQQFLQSELSSQQEPNKISIFDLAQAIQAARYDKKITGIVLDLNYFDGGDLSSISFIGKQLRQFQTSGKPVIAFSESYSQKQYYLASFADKIYLNQSGGVDLHGLAYSNTYFKSLLDKIKAHPHIFRVGTYKSAVEPFLRDNMSPEARQNATLWLTQLWENVRQEIAQNRQIDAKNIVPTSDIYLAQYKKVKGDDAQFALSQQLVTDIASNDEINQQLIERFGEGSKYRYAHIDFLSYSQQLPDRFDVSDFDKIAVINVEGEIVWGGSDEDSIGSDTISRQLRKARHNPSIHGVILRINSPGGSAMGSELIQQEIEALQKAGKPVVVSMGGKAASGGYMIAATADKIIASPHTLTGSIGIFSVNLTFEKSAAEFGIQEDGIATSPFVEWSSLKTISPAQSEYMQIGIENGYDRFLDIVSRGRKMSKEDVDRVAQGQIWLGEHAKKHGLVDMLGDFDDAKEQIILLINQARQEKGESRIEHFGVQWLTKQSGGWIEDIMRHLKISVKGELAKLLGINTVKQTEKVLGLLTKFNDPKQRYLYCLNCGTIK